MGLKDHLLADVAGDVSTAHRIEDRYLFWDEDLDSDASDAEILVIGRECIHRRQAIATRSYRNAGRWDPDVVGWTAGVAGMTHPTGRS